METILSIFTWQCFQGKTEKYCYIPGGALASNKKAQFPTNPNLFYIGSVGRQCAAVNSCKKVRCIALRVSSNVPRLGVLDHH